MKIKELKAGEKALLKKYSEISMDRLYAQAGVLKLLINDLKKEWDKDAFDFIMKYGEGFEK